ncbi:hypothetical protein JIR23_06940 [Bradyrhizobium diazoefficiens]|nr:hypothetical protein [Bradyrhizobium diazoefficiens]QQN65475.1 hypothetical protein JIR23_06940 [Bradyrhizobium diazoefficiens]
MSKIGQIEFSTTDRERSERLVRERNTPKVVWRARIVLLASDGLMTEAIAADAGKSLLTMRSRQRWLAKGMDGQGRDPASHYDREP